MPDDDSDRSLASARLATPRHVLELWFRVRCSPAFRAGARQGQESPGSEVAADGVADDVGGRAMLSGGAVVEGSPKLGVEPHRQ